MEALAVCRFGRRAAALAVLIGHTVARLITACSLNYYMFLFGRFLLSMSDIGWYTSVYVFGTCMFLHNSPF